jgi:hypothetical protein
VKTIIELQKGIRDLINRPHKKNSLSEDKATWNIICSCLDSIGDTELAINAYLDAKEPSDYGGKYLIVYGLLQTLVMRTEAVKNLWEQLLDSDYKPAQRLKDISEIRNNSAGHPTKRSKYEKDKKGWAYNFISRGSLKKSGYSLETIYRSNKEPQISYIDLRLLIDDQNKILCRDLSRIIEMLRREEAEHRAKFRRERLQEAFPLELHYVTEKIFDAIRNSSLAEIGAISTQAVKDSINSFKERLARRGTLTAYVSITHHLNQIEQALTELKTYFTNQEESNLSTENAYIFADYVRKELDELKKLASEIDEDYDSES